MLAPAPPCGCLTPLQALNSADTYTARSHNEPRQALHSVELLPLKTCACEGCMKSGVLGAVAAVCVSPGSARQAWQYTEIAWEQRPWTDLHVISGSEAAPRIYQ